MCWKFCTRIYAAGIGRAFLFSIELGTLELERFIDYHVDVYLCVYGEQIGRSATVWPTWAWDRQRGRFWHNRSYGPLSLISCPKKLGIDLSNREGF